MPLTQQVGTNSGVSDADSAAQPPTHGLGSHAEREQGRQDRGHHGEPEGREVLGQEPAQPRRTDDADHGGVPHTDPVAGPSTPGLRFQLPRGWLVGSGAARCPSRSTSRDATGPTSRRCAMSALLVGYARCSTDQQDLTAQRDALLGLGVEAERDLRRPWPDRHQPRAARPARSTRRVPGRRHPGGDQARPAGQIAARRASDRRRAHRPGRSVSQPGRVGLRPHRCGRAAAVQRAGHGRGVRVRPDPAPHVGRA